MAKTTKGTGLTIFSMVQASKFSKTVHNIAESLEMGKSMAWVHILGRMGLATKVNGTATRSRDLEFSNGQMVGGSKAAGNETNFTAVGFIPGQTAGATMASTSKTKNKDSVSTSGPMVKSMKATGKMVSSTARANLRISKASRE
jgi:hypothetical protein